MTYQTNLFNKYFQGSWYSQTNLYLMKEKIQKKSHDTLLLSLNKKTKNHITWHYDTNYIETMLNIKDLKFCAGYSATMFINKTISIFIEILNKNLFKVKYTSIIGNITYEEYIYSIDDNLIVSNGILKNTKDNQYIGLIVNSYIRIKS